MSEPSSWPLSESAFRITVPEKLIKELADHPLSESCYTTAIGYYPQAISHEMKRSDHDDFILIYCAEGKGELTIEEKKKAIKAGDLFVLPPNTPHTYRADKAFPWTVYWCHFQGKNACDFFEYIYKDYTFPMLHYMTDIDLIQSFRALVDSVKNSSLLAELIHTSNLFRHILTKIAQLSRHKDLSEGGSTSNKVPISKIQRFMRSNIDKQLSLSELASLSHCSKFHFARQYLAATGKPPLKQFIEIKIEHASFLLEQTSLSISEIASQIGYDDALYFSRVFRRVRGISPSEYRKSLIIK